MSKTKDAKQKVLDFLAAHPQATTLGIALSVAAGVAIAGDLTHIGAQMAYANVGECGHCHHHHPPHFPNLLQ